MEMLTQKQKIIGAIVIVVIIVVIGYYYINSTKEVYSYTSITNVVEETQEEEDIEIQEVETIIVHVAGAVKINGIVEVPENSRINDVIEAAGGLLDNADLSNVNLAYMVEDGQKIYIPSIDEDTSESEEQTNIISEESGIIIIESEEETESLININKASLAELMNIPGVGESTATKIIEYRTTNGKFETIEDIKNVSGIGDAKFEAMKSYITV